MVDFTYVISTYIGGLSHAAALTLATIGDISARINLGCAESCSAGALTLRRNALSKEFEARSMRNKKESLESDVRKQEKDIEDKRKQIGTYK